MLWNHPLHPDKKGERTMSRTGDCFTETVGQDGEVSVFEGDIMDTFDPNTTEDPGGHTPCDCDPQVVGDIKHDIIEAINRHKARSPRLDDADYRAYLLSVYEAAKRCDKSCIELGLVVVFEELLEMHGILGSDGDGHSDA